MKLLFDFFPALAFYIAYKIWGVYVGTFIMIVVAGIQIAYCLIRYRKITFLQGAVFALILVFGTATILLKDSAFLQWKVSIANWLLGLALLGSTYFMKTPLIQRLLGEAIELPPQVWKKLNTLWGTYFLAIGVINLVIAKLFSLNAWIDFKVFGIFGLTIFFGVAQAFYLHKYLKNTP